MLWSVLFPVSTAAATSSQVTTCRPSLILDSQPGKTNSSLLVRPSCGSLNTSKETFAVFQSRTGPGSEVDPFAEWVSGAVLTEDGISVDVHPGQEVITVVARSADGHPIFHSLNLASEPEAELDAESTILQTRADCNACHAPMCQPSCQPPLPQSCAFYKSCAEASLNCGSEGYPVRFGDKNCRAFLDRISHFSDDGQAWVFRVLTCLQEALIQPLSQCDLTCDQLFDTAFTSHPGCYADNGVCFLQLKDLVQVVVTVGSDLLFGRALGQALDLGGRCVGKYITEVDEAIDEAKQAGEFAKRVVYEGVKKFLEAFE